MTRSTVGSASLLVAVGGLGAAGQLVLLRELMAAYGGNEFSAGVTLSAWILSEALGAWLAGHAQPSFIRRSSLLSALSVLFSLAAVPAAILVRPLLGVLPGEVLSIPLLLLATLMVVLLPAAAHGALFVAAAAAMPDGVGRAYVWEGIGTVITALACFLLLSRLPSLAVVALFCLPLTATLTLVSPGSEAPPSRLAGHRAYGILLLLISVPAIILALPVERLSWSLAWRGQRVTAIANSPYGKIVRLERDDQKLVLCDGQVVLSVPPTQVERLEELALLPVLYHPRPTRILVLGSDLAIPSELARFLGGVNVVAVQIDPILARMAVTALFSDYVPPPSSWVVSDPLSYLRTTRDTFDCIILTDALPSSLGASRLYSSEFYRLCRSRLASDGILATVGPANPTFLSADLARALSTRLATLATSFEHVLPVAADFPLLLASDHRLDVSPDTLLARLARVSKAPKLLDSSYVSSLLDPFRQQAFAPQIASRQALLAIRPSSAAAPRELFLNMVRENRLLSPAFGALYARLEKLTPPLLLALGAALVIIGLVGSFRRGRSFRRGFAILTSGFSGAAASILLIFAWQVRFGSVFSGLSLLVASFMLGTVLGSILGSSGRWLHPSPPALRPFLIADCVLALSAVAAALLVHTGPAVLFLVVNCAAGACLGMQFALAGAGPTDTAARRAGILTALDLAGGSIGGILTALVLVPVFGITVSALFAGAVKLTSALAQSVPDRAASLS